MLTQPNYSWSGKRTWKLAPYGLGLLNRALRKASYESWIFDPNSQDLSEQAVREELLRTRPDAVGVTSLSTEYLQDTRRVVQIVKETLPQAIVILGGILPSVLLDKTIEDRNVDYFVIGEGEYRLPRLLDALNSERCDLSGMDGLAWGQPRVIQPMNEFISDLDDVGFPDYGDLDLASYGNHAHKYAHGILPRQFPFATVITSRGCPYGCIFCAAAAVSGRKVRLRSSANVLEEIDELCRESGIREVIFLDDHFLADRDRAIEIMQGIREREYGLTWKCVNVSLWRLDRELLQLMRDTGCYQLTLSPESGNQDVLRHIIKKPVVLDKVPELCDLAKTLGFELAANFVFGFPGETWDQIRDTCRFAERLNVDIVNFHMATPLPSTELMDLCLRGSYLKVEDGEELFGYTRGVIETSEFTPMELQTLRAFEWDRINFANPARRAAVARMEGISMEELEEWRSRTRRNLGTTIGWKE
jgi:radical SAM superfamily enzyme YgiQ (UPF0313 family)